MNWLKLLCLFVYCFFCFGKRRTNNILNTTLYEATHGGRPFCNRVKSGIIEDEGLESLEQIVRVVRNSKEISPDDMLSVLRPFCCDANVSTQSRLNVLKLLERVWKLKNLQLNAIKVLRHKTNLLDTSLTIMYWIYVCLTIFVESCSW